MSEGRLDAFRARFAGRADRGEASPRYEDFIACVVKRCDESLPGGALAPAGEKPIGGARRLTPEGHSISTPGDV